MPCTHIHPHVHTRACTHTYTQLHMHARTHIHTITHACTHAHMYTRMQSRTHIHTPGMQSRARMHTVTQMHVRAHSHIHTYTRDTDRLSQQSYKWMPSVCHFNSRVHIFPANHLLNTALRLGNSALLRAFSHNFSFFKTTSDDA